MPAEPMAAGAPTPVAVALGGLCPRCGAKTLFDGWASFAPRCRQCGLDFGVFNVGDGPAAFLTLILGAIVTAMAITLELTLHPPLWLHMLIWIPVTAIGVVVSLRAAKGALIAAEYRGAAREGRAIDPPAAPQ
ncbi:DUF983 domain-containing protein [Sphingomonas sp. PB4P5]|uniref:DUF983 domain-containing protein n=1 Tax=Parasphingomonas puruogangriensis TaxID=3096155 RepID=UPI002FCB0610